MNATANPLSVVFAECALENYIRFLCCRDKAKGVLTE
jgi:hypothetical protein